MDILGFLSTTSTNAPHLLTRTHSHTRPFTSNPFSPLSAPPTSNCANLQPIPDGRRLIDPSILKGNGEEKRNEEEKRRERRAT